MYLGDFAEDGDIFFKFTTRAFATGIPTALAGSPVLSVYKDEGGAASEKTTAEAYFDLDVTHDSIAGWNNVRIDLSGDAFFATGADYSVVITTGTVGGVSVAGENIANFSIENRSMGQPAGATLAADIAAIKAETVLIVEDTGELQADNTPTAIAAVQTVVDKIPLSDGTNTWNATALAAIQGEVDTAVAALATTADILDKIGAVNEAAAAGDPSATESVMQYVKQIVNVLTGATGIVAMPAAAAPGNGVSIAEMVRSIYDDTNELQVDDYPTSIAAIQTVVDKVPLSDGTVSWNATALAAIKTEVDAAIDTAISELSQAAPSATPTLRTGMMLLYMALRNRLDVNTTASPDVLEIYNNAGTVIAKKNVTDDGTDYSEAEMKSGP